VVGIGIAISYQRLESSRSPAKITKRIESCGIDSQTRPSTITNTNTQTNEIISAHVELAYSSPPNDCLKISSRSIRHNLEVSTFEVSRYSEKFALSWSFTPLLNPHWVLTHCRTIYAHETSTRIERLKSDTDQGIEIRSTLYNLSKQNKNIKI
jgi:hypothetical protein